MGDAIIIFVNLLWFFVGPSVLARWTTGLSKGDIKFLFYLFPYHQLLSIFKGLYVQRNGGDAIGYWYLQDERLLGYPWSEYYGIGTEFVHFITYPLVKYFKVSFYVGGLLFGLIGFFGSVFTYLIVRRFTSKTVCIHGAPVFPYILLLPNLHFWTGGIGKDALMFPAIMLYFFALTNPARKFHWALLALVAMLHVRPHIILMVLASTFLAALVDRRMRGDIKVILFSVTLAIGALLLDLVARHLDIESVSLEEFQTLSEKSLERLGEGAGSGIEANLIFPAKIFAILYRPLFLDANGLLGILVSFESVVFLVMTIALFYFRPLRGFWTAPLAIKALFIYFLMSTMAFSYILSNLGIILRQKMMFIMGFVIFFIWCVERSRAAALSTTRSVTLSVPGPPESGHVSQGAVNTES